MELKTIKISLLKEDQEPQFDIDQLLQHRQSPRQNVACTMRLHKKQNSNFTKMSQHGQSNKSQNSSAMESPGKGGFFSLKKKYSEFQSISPQKSVVREKFAIKHRAVFSANKNLKKANSFAPIQLTFERTTYTPSISPERKSLYWHSSLFPLNSTMKDAVADPLPKISANAYCAMMADTNEIIVCQNPNVEKEMASLTKIMTAYTALNICSTYGIKIREHYVSINKIAAYMNGTSAGLKPDQQILIIDLIYALLLPSGNDAGIALAQFFGKFLSYKFVQDMNSNDKQVTSMDKFKQYKEFYDTEYDKQSMKLFIFEMNKNSHKIGLKNTHFSNPTGLSDKNNYSTAKDMALLTAHCLKNHTLRVMFKKKFHTCEIRNSRLCQTRQVEWKNTNRHLFQFRQCLGAKTGITPTAGPCLSSAYKILGRQLIVIVLQSESVQDRYKDSQNLFKWCRKKIKAF